MTVIPLNGGLYLWFLKWLCEPKPYIVEQHAYNSYQRGDRVYVDMHSVRQMTATDKPIPDNVVRIHVQKE